MALSVICFGSVPNNLDGFNVDFDIKSETRNVHLNIKYLSDIM